MTFFFKYIFRERLLFLPEKMGQNEFLFLLLLKKRRNTLNYNFKKKNRFYLFMISLLLLLWKEHTWEFYFV